MYGLRLHVTVLPLDGYVTSRQGPARVVTPRLCHHDPEGRGKRGL